MTGLDQIDIYSTGLRVKIGGTLVGGMVVDLEDGDGPSVVSAVWTMEESFLSY